MYICIYVYLYIDLCIYSRERISRESRAPIAVLSLPPLESGVGKREAERERQAHTAKLEGVVQAGADRATSLRHKWPGSSQSHQQPPCAREVGTLAGVPRS